MKRKTFAFLLCTLSLAVTSCDKDAIEIGSEIFGEDHFGFEKYQVQSLQTSLVNSGVVSTRNLPQNTLGVYKNNVFGKTEAHFVTQIELGKGADFTKIGNNPVLDSVYVYIPYNSSVKASASNGESTYTLNNVYGTGKFDLSVYENGYFLRAQDPNSEFETQQFYADQKNIFDTNKKGINGNGRLNNAANKAQNEEFKASDAEILLYKYNAEGELIKDDSGNAVVKERKKPGIWLDLDKNYFQERFFTSNAYKNINSSTRLKEFFRGLYFSVDDRYSENLMMQLALSGGELVFVYKEDNSEEGKPRKRQTMTFNLGYSVSQGNERSNITVNLFENTNSQEYNNALANTASNTLWIKGNTGSLANINLLSEEELQQLKDNKWLINQAVLTVYIDKPVMDAAPDTNPARLYLYDIKNNVPIVDYINDASTSPYKYVYNGFLDDKSESGALKYRFRITNHLNNLIKKDSTNLALGLAVANDISNPAMSMLKNQSVKPNKIPVTMASMPFGTVLYGAAHPEMAKRMKVEIYYTKESN